MLTMDIIGIIILFILTIKTANRAHIKGQSPWLWGLIHLVLFFLFLFIGCFVVMVVFYANLFNSYSAANANNPDYSRQIAREVGVGFSQHPLQGVTVMLFGIGGYMLVRFILNRMPDKNLPLHKMDRPGNND